MGSWATPDKSLIWLQIAEAMEPDLAYFVDPNQNFISDYFQALTQAGTSLGSVQGSLSESKHMHRLLASSFLDTQLAASLCLDSIQLGLAIDSQTRNLNRPSALQKYDT